MGGNETANSKPGSYAYQIFENQGKAALCMNNVV